METPPHFDFKRHWQDWHRYVLPIFVIVAAILMIMAIVLRSGKQTDELNAAGYRVGLLAPGPGAIFDPAFAVTSPIEMVRTPRAPTFDYPMGSRLGALTYNAQPFMTNSHLGDDLNGIGGWNSDLGDPVYAVADGLSIYAGWPSEGWGNVVILLHELPNGHLVETFYGHLDSIKIPVGKRVRRGDLIGTVGTANGRYLAHLHFEVRRYPTLDVGQGYYDEKLGRLSGELSLRKWRHRPHDRLSAPPAGAPLPPKPLQVTEGPPS